MANPHPDKPVFGMVTNGDDVLFIKLTQAETPQYDLSRVFALFTSKKELYEILQILKRIGEAIACQRTVEHRNLAC
ncbi:hypothetical protein CEN49_27370 [Fischerella thermalis CCMEE 5273]|uniref:Type I restriction enzyme R protein N-terminal domain-containing protein n=1 Tax=Chlorogloeopsis fritschii PCC 6912 TaxID=211165 RepID=A0A3S0XY93_CHLFR|nr:hypothetical protein [Chlorogloeopsis fritschii]PMB01574.1 hypothetical protein CEN49_27370 [Fischerella thermalis CCMEE 5273]RUR83762.1 hypothetical protein PCC6912_20050 [Chlorogloeopsis fritschii PCC 6912]